MKVYDRGLTPAETGHTQDVQKLGNNSAGKSATKGADTSGDRVEFSGTLGRLSRTLSTYDTSRANRVQSLAAQYQSGNYHPDSAATSRGMIERALSERRNAPSRNSIGCRSRRWSNNWRRRGKNSTVPASCSARRRPKLLDRCSSVLEATGRRLTEWQPRLAEAAGNPDALAEAWQLAAQFPAHGTPAAKCGRLSS